MLKVKEHFFDRFEQSFLLLKNNFLGLFLPFFIYNFISVVIVGTILQYNSITELSDFDFSKTPDIFSFLNNATVVLYITIGITFYILYLILYVIIFLGFLKSVRQAINEEKITMKENFYYGIYNFNNSMKTYWYIFSYIVLIPSIIFIIGGLLLSFGYYGNIDILRSTGYFILSIAILIFIFFAIYRGIKSIFALYSAVDKNSFTLENFYNSIKITQNNWLRILGNIIFLGILLSIISGIVSGVFNLLLGILGLQNPSLIDILFGKFSSISGNINTENQIKEIINSYTTNFSVYKEIISNIVSNTLSTIFKILDFIFIYIFYLRLDRELKYKNGELQVEGNNSEKEKIDKDTNNKNNTEKIKENKKILEIEL